MFVHSAISLYFETLIKESSVWSVNANRGHQSFQGRHSAVSPSEEGITRLAHITFWARELNYILIHKGAWHTTDKTAAELNCSWVIDL